MQSSDMQSKGATPMSSLELDVDVQLVTLESEWRQAYEDSILARGEYQALAVSDNATAELLDLARERMERAEAVKERIMNRIEWLEGYMLGLG